MIQCFKCMLMELHINQTTNLVTNKLLVNKELQIEQSRRRLEKDLGRF